MPIYEYFCHDCRKRVDVFFRTIQTAENQDAFCPECEGKRLERLVSRVRMLRSDESRMDALADDSALMAGLEGEDPQALAGLMRRMSDESGEALDDEMTEVIDRLESGECPESIEQSVDLSDAPSDAPRDSGAGGGSGGFS